MYCTVQMEVAGGRWHVAGGKELIWKSPKMQACDGMKTSMVMTIRVKAKREEDRRKSEDRSIDGSNIEWKPLRLLFAGYSRT